MRFKIGKSLVVLCLLIGLLLPATGCDSKSWPWLAPTFASGAMLGYLLGTQSETVIVERTCYENGVLVDCSQIAGP